MNRSHAPSRLWVGFALLAVLGTASHGAPQGYLSDEEIAPSSIDQLTSVLDDIGLYRPDLAKSLLVPGVLGKFPATDDWLQDSSLMVRSRSYYRYRDEGNGNIREAFATGGSIEFESGWLHDTFRLGLTGFTSQKLHGDADRDGTGLLQLGQRGYTALGEAYLEVRHAGVTTHLFRQEINVPFINRHDSRMTPKTFEAYLLSTEDPLGISGLSVGGGHITKVKDRTSSRFVPLSHRAGVRNFDRGVSAIGARYRLSEKAMVGATNQYGWDLWNTFYAEAELTRPITGTSFTSKAGLQVIDQRSIGDKLAGDFETQLFGASLALGLRGFITSAAFTSTGDDSTVRNPWGGNPSYNSVMVSDFDRPGEDSYRLGFSYDFADLGLDGFSTFANFVHGEAPGSPDQDEWNLTVDYRQTQGLLKDFWIRIRAGQNDREGGVTRDEFRVIFNYSRSF
ncbi:MAG: OprD family outer membrane porin [Verrucomicrobiales bacterium]